VDLTSLEPLTGGWSGRTFVGEVAGERSVVRIYPPEDDRAERGPEIDAAVLLLVRGLLPVADVREVRQGTEVAPGVLVTSLLPGVRADELLPTLDDDQLRVVGAHLGRLAADVAGMPQLRAGVFVDGELHVRPHHVDGLPDLLERLLPELGHLAPGEVEALRDVAAEAQTLLDTVTRASLVHGDLDPRNLLLDPTTLELTGVVDWELAHAGHPFTDLGSLLRFERAPAFAEAVLAAYAEQRGTPPELALRLARAADLGALIDLAARRGRNPVANRADALLRAVARERDPGADVPAQDAP
jgi:aminoglycoside phosphotransferase (APT) family kinase protein